MADINEHTAKPAYRRVLLKLSGEDLQGERTSGISGVALTRTAHRLKEVLATGVQVAIVVGGGNFVRGRDRAELGVEAVTADYMGMLGTSINALALQDAMEKAGCVTRLMTGFRMPEIGEQFIRRRAIRHLEKGRAVIFAAGFGKPMFTTDTAAAHRAVEIDAEVLIKATHVDGVYSADPARDPGARFLPSLTYTEVVEQRLKVMDLTAITFCQDQGLPIIIFNHTVEGNMLKVICGDKSIGSTVTC